MGIVNDYIQKVVNFFKHGKTPYYEKAWHQYYGTIPQHLNYPDDSIYDRLADTASEHADRIAYRYFGTECTYKKFLKKISQITDALTQFDIIENECITVCLPNTPESFALIYAINKIGAIANIVHPLSSTADIKRALKEADSQILFCSDVSIPKAKNIKVKHFILVPTNHSFRGLLKILYGLKNYANLRTRDNIITWNDFLSCAKYQNVYTHRTGNDPAVIIYSGGTTGKPKGIIISNRNFNAMALQTKKVCSEIKPGRVLLSYLPIFHVFGFAVCCHTGLTNAMTCVIMPRINTKKINKEFNKHKPDIIPAIPSILRLSLKDKNIHRRTFKNVKVVVVGGDYLPSELKIAFEDFLHHHGTKAIIKVGYGLSETTGFCCSTAPLDEIDVVDSTIGIPNPDMDIKICIPNTTTEQPINEIGEICVSGPTVMLGYINEDKETKKTLKQHADQKTWLHTGDLGYMDNTGRLFYSSRLKRMIIANGYNIYPIELESIINRCKYVASCIVVGIPHPTKGQTPKAVIVLKENYKETPFIRNAIRQYCRDNLATYAVPTEFEYRKNLPVTAVGKVAFKELEKHSRKK